MPRSIVVLNTVATNGRPGLNSWLMTRKASSSTASSSTVPAMVPGAVAPSTGSELAATGTSYSAAPASWAMSMSLNTSGLSDVGLMSSSGRSRSFSALPARASMRSNRYGTLS